MPNSKSIKVKDEDYEFLHMIAERMNITYGEALQMCLNFKKNSKHERFVNKLVAEMQKRPALSLTEQAKLNNTKVHKLSLIDRLRRVWHFYGLK